MIAKLKRLICDWFHAGGRVELRDYFAAKVLSDIYADYLKHAEQHGFIQDWRIGVAKDAYEMADAMMKVRDSAS